MKKWEKISSKYLIDNQWIKVRQDTVKLPTGKIIEDFYLFEENNVALVVPVTPEDKFVFVRQYKHAYGDVTTEFPAGYIENNETPIKAATRELKEETGFQALKIEELKFVINTPTKVKSNIHTFLATGCTQIHNQKTHQDDNEDIEIILASFEEAHQMIMDSTIIVTGTIANFYLAAEKLGKIKLLNSLTP